MASKLLSLPAELLASIADELDVGDYGNLRLCCRQAEKYTFPYFAKRFFSRRKFFRGHLSLSTLLSISESRFSPYLETFILSAVQLEKDAPIESETVSNEAYLEAYAEQTSILASGWDCDMLVAAFKNLPNLSSIGTEEFDDHGSWDFDGGGMDNENDGGYGLKTLLSSLRFEPGRPPRQTAAAYHWVVSTQTLLAAVAKANVRPKALKINGRNLNGSYIPSDALGGIDVDDDAFNVPSFLRPLILPMVEGLEELSFDVHKRYIYPAPENPASCRTKHLREFLGYPTKLQKLGLRRLVGGLHSLEPTEQDDGFWSWIGADHKGKDKAPAGQQQQGPAGPSNPLISPPPIAFPYLRELELGSEHIPLADLVRLLKKVSPTLRAVSLHDLVLRDRQDELTSLDDDVRTEVDLWASFCGKLAALPCEDLYEVNISGFGGLGTWHLQEFGDALAEPESVYFKVLEINGEDSYKAQAEFSYRGPDVKNALGHLADDLRAAVKDGRHVFTAEAVQRRNSF